MEKITRIASRTMVLDIDNIDTDQIIPARFLTTTGREGLGEAAFHDWRYKAEGQPNPDFMLNRKENEGRAILVAGDNFGCGSSREHAPWALLDSGLRAVISTRIADIFRSNSLKNGFVPVVIDARPHRWLVSNPGAEVVIDLENACVELPEGPAAPFEIERFARYCLMNGVDQLGYLIQQEERIGAWEQRRA
ncbi:MAG: 3-isopropylmalate dehydratase small subunit [Gammaproteobacteria bacterium]|nr:3-isopropylmalate dehydratase small subunit [Gammaproteobacteria bacterium]